MLLLTFFLGCFALVTNRHVEHPSATSGLNPQVLSKLDSLATNQHLEDALRYGEDALEKAKRMENSIAGSRVKVAKGGISYAQIIDGYPTQTSQKQDYVARMMLKASSHFAQSYCKPEAIPASACAQYLSEKDIPVDSKVLQKCQMLIGKKTYNDEYRRLLPANYHDGIYEFRKSVSGRDLPDPRNISSRFHATLASKSKEIDNLHTVALVQWTQFIEHDLAKTTVQTMYEGTPIECCSSAYSSVLPRYLHYSCAPLKVSDNDPFYKAQRVTCLNYVRSALSLGNRCHLGAANQLNQATTRLDLSQLYGNHESETQPLRSGRGGKLRSQSFDKLDYLDENTDRKFCVANASLDVTCYTSGDSRVNVNPFITLLHTLFLRSHNRIAKQLVAINPHWEDEQLFKTTRSVNIKLYQGIIREWSQSVLGKPISIAYRFDGKTQPSVSNEFATAAIRFHNTMMPGEITGVPGSRTPQLSLELEDLFYKPKDLRKKEYFSHLLNSVMLQNAMPLDTSYVDDMAQHLFKTKNVGTDVLALDIQRGRDHGLSGYTKYFELCSGRSVQSWSDLSSVMHPEDLKTLQSAYASIHDVDLIVGAVAEKPQGSEALVGPTLECILRDQLAQSLDPDSHRHHDWQHPIDAVVANYTAARFLCDTAQLRTVQRNIFRTSDSSNPAVRCSQLPELNLIGLREII